MTFKSRLPPKHFGAQRAFDMLVIVGSHVDFKVRFGWETSGTHFADIFYKKCLNIKTKIQMKKFRH